MKKKEQNKNVCELLGGEIDIVEEQERRSSHRKLFKKGLESYENSCKRMQNALDKMDAFCKMKRNLFLPIRGGSGTHIWEENERAHPEPSGGDSAQNIDEKVKDPP